MRTCIADCPEARIEGSAFCQPHGAAHERSAWVKAWRKYQKEVAKKGVKNVLWVAPRKVEND